MKILFLLLMTIAINLNNGLDNGLGRTPPMGWLSWERFECNIDCVKYPTTCINEQLYKDMADRLSADGFKELGYLYVDIDDCWLEKERDSNQKLVADKKRFSSGIKNLADYVHAKGLKLGIYGDVGPTTCAGYPAQNGENGSNYFEIDAKTFAEWGVDSLKFDGCNQDPKTMDVLYPNMSKALNDSGRPILYNCQWPMYQFYNNITPNYDEIIKYCNVFRNRGDISDSWDSVANTIQFYAEHQDLFSKYNGPGHFYDPDMLIIGDYGLSYDQSVTQMAFWALWSVPLYMSNDLRSLKPELKKILQNKAVIAVNQDPSAKLGIRVIKDDRHEVWVKQMNPIINDEYSYAVIYYDYDRIGSAKYLSYPLSEILKDAKSTTEFVVTDLFADEGSATLGSLKLNNNLELLVNPAGSVRMVKLVPKM